MTEKNNSSSIEEKYQEITANLRKTKRISPFWLLPLSHYVSGQFYSSKL